MNGYGQAWRSCVRSHRRYAERSACDYVCVDLPWTVAATEAAWLKVALMVRVLEDRRYQWVLFVDADAMIRSSCPDFRAVAIPGPDIYLAQGHSGRVNSGVMVVRASDASLRFFRELLSDCENVVTGEDAAPYENGHVIKHSRGNPTVGLIERRWNNTVDPDLDDYIRHFTGPMAVEARLAPFSVRGWRCLWRLRNCAIGLWTPALKAGALHTRLQLMTEAVTSRCGAFADQCA
jgi:hypothetical protein